MVAPWGLNSVSGNRGVEGENQTEKPKEQAKLNTGATLQESPYSKGDKKRHDKHDYRDDIALRFRNGLKHQAAIIPEEGLQNSFSALRLKGELVPTPGLVGGKIKHCRQRSCRRCLLGRCKNEPRPSDKETQTAQGSNCTQPTVIC